MAADFFRNIFNQKNPTTLFAIELIHPSELETLNYSPEKELFSFSILDIECTYDEGNQVYIPSGNHMFTQDIPKSEVNVVNDSFLCYTDDYSHISMYKAKLLNKYKKQLVIQQQSIYVQLREIEKVISNNMH